MSWHTPAYTASIIPNAGNVDLAALTDQVLTVFNSHFLLRKPMRLFAAQAFGATLSRARFDSPTLRYYGNPYIEPINVSAIAQQPARLADYQDYPFVLPAGEEIAIQITGTAAVAEQDTAVLWLMDNLEPIGGGNIYPVRFTSTTAAVANKWTTLTYTMESALPVGLYALVYSQLQHTNAQVHRWIFDEQVYRPGFLSTPGIGDNWPITLQGFPWGVAGRFRNDALPRLEVLADGADASYEGRMWLQKVAA